MATSEYKRMRSPLNLKRARAVRLRAETFRVIGTFRVIEWYGSSRACT